MPAVGFCYLPLASLRRVLPQEPGRIVYIICLNVHTEAKNDTRDPIFQILHVDVGHRGVVVAIYQKLQVSYWFLTMDCLYLGTLMTLK